MPLVGLSPFLHMKQIAAGLIKGVSMPLVGLSPFLQTYYC